ncbi:hypothetical protein FHS14_001912 [Paenibacillus baekrokdamisoli]|nr:hypothetical protein [Paenibacillus baekrokdamisoli]
MEPENDQVLLHAAWAADHRGDRKNKKKAIHGVTLRCVT